MARKTKASSRSGLSRGEWERLVAEYDRSEETRQAFCAERGISVSSLDYWRRKLREEQTPSFIELGSVSAAGAAAAWDIELELGGGVVLRFRRG